MSDDFASPRDRDQTIYITWDDAGRIEAPGRVKVEGKSFRVEQVHIDVWQDQTGTFALFIQPGDPRTPARVRVMKRRVER